MIACAFRWLLLASFSYWFRRASFCLIRACLYRWCVLHCCHMQIMLWFLRCFDHVIQAANHCWTDSTITPVFISVERFIVRYPWLNSHLVWGAWSSGHDWFNFDCKVHWAVTKADFMFMFICASKIACGLPKDSWQTMTANGLMIILWSGYYQIVWKPHRKAEEPLSWSRKPRIEASI